MYSSHRFIVLVALFLINSLHAEFVDFDKIPTNLCYIQQVRAQCPTRDHGVLLLFTTPASYTERAGVASIDSKGAVVDYMLFNGKYGVFTPEVIFLWNDNTFIVGGTASQGSKGGTDIEYLQISYNKQILKDSCIGTSNNEWLLSGVYGFDSTGVGLGQSCPITGGDTTTFVFKISAHGYLVWKSDIQLHKRKVFGFSAASDGGFIIVGNYADPIVNSVDSDVAQPSTNYTKRTVFLLKLSSTGEQLWQRTLGSKNQDLWMWQLLREHIWFQP